MKKSGRALRAMPGSENPDPGHPNCADVEESGRASPDSPPWRDSEVEVEGDSWGAPRMGHSERGWYDPLVVVGYP